MTTDTNREKLSIIMADDDADDRLLTQSAFEENLIRNPMYFVENGQELLDFLQRKGKYTTQQHRLPSLILLDLNMPKMDGREALREIKSDPNLKKIPVLILTTSKSEKDILESYALGASCFISKPSNFEGLLEVVKNIGRFWLETASIPENAESVHENS